MKTSSLEGNISEGSPLRSSIHSRLDMSENVLMTESISVTKQESPFEINSYLKQAYTTSVMLQQPLPINQGEKYFSV